MRLLDIAPGTKVTIEAEQNGKVLRFHQDIKKITESERRLLISKIGSNVDYCIIEPVIIKGKMVSFAANGVIYRVTGIIDNNPYRWTNINIARVSFNSSGLALVIYTLNMGARFERRGGYRQYIGVKGVTHTLSQGAVNNILIHDMSLGGIGLIVPNSFRALIGENIRIQYVDNVKEHSQTKFVKFDLRANVVREQPLDKNTKVIGCVLTQGDRNAISSYLSAKQRKSIHHTAQKKGE